MKRRHLVFTSSDTLFPYPTLFRASSLGGVGERAIRDFGVDAEVCQRGGVDRGRDGPDAGAVGRRTAVVAALAGRDGPDYQPDQNDQSHNSHHGGLDSSNIMVPSEIPGQSGYETLSRRVSLMYAARGGRIRPRERNEGACDDPHWGNPAD